MRYGGDKLEISKEIWHRSDHGYIKRVSNKDIHQTLSLRTKQIKQ